MVKKSINTEVRNRVLIGAVCFIVVVYTIQLFNLQVLNKDYKVSADSNAFLKKTLYPARGTIYDRNGELLVYNQPAYEVMVVMREVQAFDTLAFCRILNISKDYYVKRIRDIKNKNLNPGYSSYVSQVFLSQLDHQEYGALQEMLYKFPGFYIQPRPVRQYSYPNGAHVLGYISQVDKKGIAEDDYYVQGDYAGKAGLERSYEKYLRGEKGEEILLRDAHGRIKGKYEEGIHDKSPVSGKNLRLSLDMKLQAYGESLMKNKLGSIVMIEPSTGEILCMVSSPTYDPSILVGRQFQENYTKLEKDPYKPLLNRPIQGTYPPGSTFKPAQALIFLQEGAITPSSSFSCIHGYPVLGGRPACHGHPVPLSLAPAVATSCNAYFCYGLRAMVDDRKKYSTAQDALEVWKEDIVSEGYGYRLGVDLPGENRGFIPNSQVYDKVFNKRWNSSTIISISIGQGEITATPLQIANLAATIANGGYYYVPHVVKEIESTALDSIYTTRQYTKIDPQHYKVIQEGMAMAVTWASGTCKGINLSDQNLIVCGKTGTAQNPHGKDHSAFMGFAPKENPRVAIAVYVENGGFGATVAVPIARLMLQKYLNRKIVASDKSPEDDPQNALPSSWDEIPASEKYLEEHLKNMVILPNALQKN